MDILKKTGIIRRMDDLGRIVFPKNLRAEIKAKENDPFELGVAEVNGVKFLAAVPYNPSSTVLPERDIVNLLKKQSGLTDCVVVMGNAYYMTRTEGSAGANEALAKDEEQMRLLVMQTKVPARSHQKEYELTAAPIMQGNMAVSMLLLVYKSQEAKDPEALNNLVVQQAQLLSTILGD